MPSGPSIPTDLRSSRGAVARCLVCSVSNTLRLHIAYPSEQLLNRREQRWYRRLAGVGHVQLSVQGYDADNLLVVPPGFQTIADGFGSCVNPGELIKHFASRFERRAGYSLELQCYSLIAALRARVSPVIKIVIVHLQPVAMYDQQHMTKTRWSRHSLRIGPTNLLLRPFWGRGDVGCYQQLM
jgi:hypothetical protein